ncbi:hypothetical protein R70723_26265 [Paenibacillus sp. FSL R7-0273]|uniref:hypothetical protein n=1 Tax=Paenibacillus sp. FSL R7-0273 TaxID=1536772 RepID=UPI0004F59702|nr:hypothetical protein [Paenibacillus sp. FSL R7-0273]AIQ49015.1 hypothetical protein R70723_26265 [Paenibacillus sp. FSL R7-0273]OMF90574.1 hypothetical protein BK144_17325 [Paenibacillus sp. FSL R7-0273]
MSWSLFLLLSLLLVPVFEIPQLIKLRSRRDLLVFLGIWAVALASTIGVMAGLPQWRVLDWARSFVQLFPG